MKIKPEKNELNIKKLFLKVIYMALGLSVLQILMHIGNSGILSFLDAFNPVNLLINVTIFMFAILILVFITGKLNLSFIIVSVFTQGLLIVNYYKIYFLSVPLKASDLILGKEATGILENYEITVSIKVVLFTVLVILACVLVFKYVKTQKISFKVRIPGLLITALLAGLCYNFVYTDYKIYENTLFFSNEFSEVDIANGHGFVYSLFNSVARTQYDKPDGYDKKEAKAMINADEYKEELPNVIAVMGEAFFDIRQAENLKFNENPLEFYDKLKSEGMYGEIVVPGFAGNTSSAEFEFLTGVNISLVNKGLPVPYKTFLNRKAYGLPNVFKNLGYETVGMHPGYSWFYNRELAYKCLGFSKSVFIDDLGYRPKMTNYYANDEEAAKMIVEDYKNHLEKNPDKGYFNFTVTIQNHGPYIDHDTDKEDIVKRIDGMEDKAYYTIDNYVQGLKDADNFLKTIKEFIETTDKPTVVVFFGDHLPFMDAELSYYDMMGYDITSESDEALLRKYKTPYLIFSNTAYKNREEEKGNSIKSGYRGIISSSYLSTELFEYMNAKMPAYYEYLNELKYLVNIISPHYYMINGEFRRELEGDVLEKINTLKKLQYYNMIDYGK